MSKFLIAVVISAIAAFCLAPRPAQARHCSGVVATARGITQNIATNRAERRLNRYVRRNLSGWGVQAGPRNACVASGVHGFRQTCKSGAVVCK